MNAIQYALNQVRNTIPLKVLGRALFGRFLNEVKVQYQVQGGDSDHKEAEADAKETVTVNKPDAGAKESHHKTDEI